MATTAAFMTTYREEYIPTFERRRTRLRESMTTEASIKGNVATFLVAGSGSATATTRGTNGLIPARNNSNTQNSVTLVELNDLVEGTKFTYDLSQGNQRRIAQTNSADVIHRKIDDQIITELDTATINDTASTADLDKVTTALATLGNANVPIQNEDDMFAVVTPAFIKYLMMIPAFASADYVAIKPFDGPAVTYKRWMGVNWIMHSGLTGVGTASEKCYMYHRDAMGHAINLGDLDTAAGYDERQATYWARSSAWAEAGLLQNSGIVQMVHDGSATALS